MQGSSPESGRSPGEGNGNLFQYSCLGNPKDRGSWRATAHGVAKEVRHDLAPFLVFKGTSKLFCIVITAVYIPSRNTGGFPFRHTLSSMYY